MIVLASASPRRRELLTQVGYQFKVVPSSVEEEMEDGTPIDIVKHNALIKAQDIAKSYPKDIVIGADTIVVVNGRIFGKPQDENDAEKMLAELSGSVHQVMTGIAVVQGERIHSEVVVTDVTMRNYDMDEIHAYIATGEPMDKAGAYGIQGEGGKFVLGYEGGFDTIMGLSVELCEKLIRKALMEVIE